MIFTKDKRLLNKLRTGDIHFRSTVASDANTPAAVLQSLADDPSVDVRLAVTSNRTASEETLFTLGHDSEKSVRAAALSRLLDLLGLKSATRAIKQSSTSPQLLAVIAEDLSSHSSEMRALCGTTHRWEDENGEFPEPRVGVLAEVAKARNPVARIEVAKSNLAPPSLLGSLANDLDDAVRLAVAGNTSTPPKVLEALLDDSSSAIRKRALANKSLPKQAIATTASDESPDVRQQLALGAETPVDLLTQLARDPVSGVRKTVAENANTPDALLVELASDADAEVRMAVALGAGTFDLFGGFSTRENYRRKTPAAALLALARDGEPNLRMAVASSPRLPLDAFVALANDPDAAVRQHVAQVIKSGYHQPLPGSRQGTSLRKEGKQLVLPEALTCLVDSTYLEIRSAIAQHPQVPANLLARLLDDKRVFDWDEEDSDKPWGPERKLRPFSVLHERTWNSPADWQVLVRVSNPQARGVLAFSDGTPNGIVDLLAGDADAHVRECVLSNRGLPATALRRLMDDPSGDVTDRAFEVFRQQAGRLQGDLGIFVDAPRPEVRATVARAEKAQHDWLEKLASDADPTVRAAVATNASTPPELVVLLATDPEPEVVDAIVSNVGGNRLPPETLDELSGTPHSKIRATVAVNLQVSDDALKALVCDPEESVRLAAATNGFHHGAAFISAVMGDDFRKEHGIGQQNVPRLVLLAQDESLGSEPLHSLAQSPFDEVRACVAANHATTTATTANLARDKKSIVRAAVARHPNTPQEGLTVLAMDGSPEVRRGVATNPNTPAAALASLDRDTDDEVALAVALRETTTQESLAALMEVHCEPQVSNSNSRLLQSMAAGGHPPQPLLDALVPWRRQLRELLLRSDHRWQQGVRQVVAANPLTPVGTLGKLSQQPDTAPFVAANPSTPADILVRLVYNGDELVREAVAESPNTPEAELGALALDQQEGVRLRVASNLHTSVGTLEILANDFSSRVKNAAIATMSAVPDS